MTLLFPHLARLTIAAVERADDEILVIAVTRNDDFSVSELLDGVEAYA